MDAKIPNSAAGQEAIDRLLWAQQQADVALVACREKAEGILVTAREQVREIERKADIRVGDLHKQRAKKIKKRVQALIARNQGENGGELGQAHLDQAVRRLAAQLTGGGEP